MNNSTYKLKYIPPYPSLHWRIVGMLFLLFALSFQSIKAQEEAQYNRFQFHKFHWRVFHSKSFHIYFPADAADSLYRFLATETPDAIAHIKKVTLKELPKNINIVIYPSVSKSYETNIGGFEPRKFTFPTFAYKGTRIVLAYNGSYADLRAQLYEALARVLWETQMNDGTKVDPATDKTAHKKGGRGNDDIPYWFKEGAIRYFANGWTIADEDKFRTSFEQNNFSSLEQILAFEPRLGGQAFCYFLQQNYYPLVVAQACFQIKKKKSLSRGLRLVTKQDIDSLSQQCYAFYKARFNTQNIATARSIPAINFHHKKGLVQQVLINPAKDLIAYVLLEKASRNVYIIDTKQQLTTMVATYKLPPWIDDHHTDQYPLLYWHTDGKQLYIAQPRKGKISIGRYSANGKMQERNIITGVDGIRTFQPLSDREFLLTAYRKGQSDIVAYDDNHERFIAYTDDEYDDAQPLLTANQKDILFVSDRPGKYQERKTYLIGVGYKKDTLHQGIYTIKNGIIKPLVVDSVPYVRWDKLVPLKNGLVLATTTKYGREQHILLNPTTDQTTSLGDFRPYQYLPSSDEISYFKTDRDSVHITFQPLDEWIKKMKPVKADTTSPWLNDHHKILAAQATEASLLKGSRDTTHYFLDNVFSAKQLEDTTKTKRRKPKVKNPVYYGDPNVEPYVLQLHSAFFTAQVNNDYFINRYQPYLNYQGEFKFPEVGGITRGGFTDLLENHHFTIAYKLPAATDGSDFFLRYENTERRIDWGFSYFRKVETLKPDPNRNWVDENGNKYPGNAKGKTHNYELFLKYPVTFYSYFGLQTALRKDKTIFLATDKYSLDFLLVQSAWSITTITYSLNKTQPTVPNLHKGFATDMHMDLFKGFNQTEPFVFGTTANFGYHFPIYKYITLVTQVHAGYSGGDQKVLYNLGGTDNNVTPKVDTSVHFAKSAPYAFQTLVTPFRGYAQNSLYGTRFLSTNIDLYFPLFQTLIPIVTPLPFINNLQLGAFTDIGTAKEKWYTHSGQGKWLSSYGISARTTLAGYPLRFDIAWPSSFNKSPVWYLSLKL